MEDVDIVVKAPTGEGDAPNRVVFMCYHPFAFYSGTWPKSKMTNGDVVRLHLACDVIKVNP